MPDPLKHHFLPIFYLKRWMRPEDKKLVEYRKAFDGDVRAKSVYPAATAYVHRLYEKKGMAPEVALEFESTFLAPVDSGAAQAMQLMLRCEHGDTLSAHHRQAWTQFLLSLEFRMPADIRALKANVRDDWILSISDMEDRYAGARRPSDPESLGEFLDAQDSSVYEESAMSIAKRMITHENVSRTIRKMYWSVVSLEASDFELLTSDRPVITTEQFNRRDSYIVLPIGPRHLFVALFSRGHSTFLRSRTQTQLARWVNLRITEGATQLVYSRDDRQKSFVVSHFGINRPPSHLERLQAFRRDRAADLLGHSTK
ncbi:MULTISPECIES: DUF4238 domain-containing protein [unclassified Mesorhizobium]|uniref:DUF4238 domain-containing protein n=1 Tax=unclassified Mesorhizobium TaxID=325217 RepID=UPI001093FD73|nr:MULTISPECIES: DUF4238 domain-containing protein [unclassified Mesorhizobium]TGT85419.1 DUF4238 domain-containing protein [Mesorhizobium sp. M8A.F.Ca.ET.161.01.1.1]TGV39366.1 DUF4238 domain-containing protein [Mesorhizobium sp. M8A.F.Ca.ET.142.01.1.1]